MTEKEDKRLFRCHFCEKNQHQVKKLIAGPYANICSDCVVKCVEVLAEVEPRQGDNQ
jgi:ATP-dependent Clp protease ATP-binding subunit ClpX